MKNNFRLEISFKNIPQLEKKIKFCIQNNISKINIPCKGEIKKDLLLDSVRFIGENYKNINTVYHYSLYHQYFRNSKESYKNLLLFLKLCNFYNNNQILIVSGSIRRENFDLLELLQHLKTDLDSDEVFLFSQA